jgi:ribulose-phosphate 3-epimerase
MLAGRRPDTLAVVIQPPRIAASILAADFARLGAEVSAIEAHVEMLHVDVMDGHFVPNISLGMPVIASLRKATDLPLDCHLMISNPDAYLEALKEAGADLITVHIEAVPEPTGVAALARDLDLGFGLVLNPPTPFAAVEPFVELCDMLLVMSVHPGFGGQSFIVESLGKVEQARRFIDAAGLATLIEIDGGIDATNAAAARGAGADVFVAGTSIFRAPDPAGAAAEIRAAVSP